MTQKYYTVDEAAKLLGVTPAEVNRLREHRELFGVNTGVSWKFKAEEVEKLVRDRRSGKNADDEGSGDEDVLLSEAELGESDPSKSGTVIGSGKGLKPSESDIQFAGSDVNLDGSGLNFADGKAGKPRAAEPKGGGVPSKGRADEIDLTLDEDLSLEDDRGSAGDKVAPGNEARPPPAAPRSISAPRTTTRCWAAAVAAATSPSAATAASRWSIRPTAACRWKTRWTWSPAATSRSSWAKTTCSAWARAPTPSRPRR